MSKIVIENTQTVVEIAHTGLPGPPGAEIELRVDDNQLQWRYTGEPTWNTLLDTSALAGEFRVENNVVQWQLPDQPWVDLIDLNDVFNARDEAQAAATAAEAARDLAQGYANTASAAATTASDAATAATNARDAAQLAQTAAETAQSAAETAQGLAESARDDSQAARDAAQAAQTAAETARDAALAAQTAAETARDAAQAAQAGAETARDAAQEARDEAQALAASIPAISERIITGTTHTLEPSDGGAVLITTSDDPVTITIAANATQALPARAVVTIIQGGDGQVKVEAGSGVTLHGFPSTQAQHTALSLYQRESLDTWQAIGGVE